MEHKFFSCMFEDWLVELANGGGGGGAVSKCSAEHSGQHTNK